MLDTMTDKYGNEMDVFTSDVVSGNGTVIFISNTAGDQCSFLLTAAMLDTFIDELRINHQEVKG